MAQDEELAIKQAEQPVTQQDAEITFTEWTPETELLTALVELLGEHLAFTAAVNSKDHKVHHPKPLPRPKRAIDAVLRRAMDELYDSLIDDIERSELRQGEGEV